MIEQVRRRQDEDLAHQVGVLLIDGGRRDTVRTLREEYQLVIEPIYIAVVERASGRRVDGFASRTVVHGDDPPWASEVFRLGTIG